MSILLTYYTDKYGIYPSFHKQRKNQYRLYIPRRYYEELKERMEPYIHESMKYKLQHSKNKK